MHLHSKEAIFQKIETFLAEHPDGVIEILGPTASGKTGFSIEVARKFGPAEIISVDSRQIYRDIDIASAKITTDEMSGVPHHGLDLINPDQNYSVFEFQQYGFETIEHILKKKALPILCGGTMLWLDAISEHYIFSNNKETKSTQQGEPKWPVLKIGMHWERDQLYDRINQRSAQMFENGMIEETEQILKKWDITRQARTSIGYEEVEAFLNGEITREQALEQNQKRSRNYAKRQLTWWRGREDILWLTQSHIDV